nr:response regulator transcription factor [uncultured Dyadobacter sp.]
MISVTLLDDHPAITSAVVSYLKAKEDIHILETFTRPDELLAAKSLIQTDVLICDMLFADGFSGIEVLIQLKRRSPGMKVIFFSMIEREEDIRAALAGGADGYVLKRYNADKVYKAIREVIYEKERYLSPEVVSILNRQAPAVPRDEVPEDLKRLSSREFQVLQLYGQDKNYGAIADELNISENTVRTHVAAIKKKLNVTKTRMYMMVHEFKLIPENP